MYTYTDTDTDAGHIHIHVHIHIPYIIQVYSNSMYAHICTYAIKAL